MVDVYDCGFFFQSMADEFTDVCFAKVNVDENSVCSEIQIVFVCVYSVLMHLSILSLSGGPGHMWGI